MTPARPYVLSIDLGTSGPKAALVASDGKIAATAAGSVKTQLFPDGGAEQDPEEVWQSVLAVCRTVLNAAQVPNSEVEALICSSQYASIVPVDENGLPVGNMILWMDRRGAPEAMAQFQERGYRPDSWPRKLQWIYRHGLLPLDSGADGLAHIRWLQYARPEIYQRSAYLLEPMDYLTMRFTGRATANHCTAFLMLLTNNRVQNQTRWDPRLLKFSGVDPAKLPKLLPDNAIVGNVASDVAASLGLTSTTKVVTGINDTQAAALACCAFQGTHAAVGVGTSSVMVTHVPFKKTSPSTSMYSMPSPVPGVRFAVAENGVAGKTLEHFLENLIFANDSFGNHAAEERFLALDRAADQVPPGSNGIIFLPWVDGAMAPVTDASMRGGFLNISLQTRREDLARAVLEGVAYSFRWLLESTERFSGRPVSHVQYYGGGAMSGLWSQIIADILGLPVHQLENPRYANCLGAALLAFERLGFVQFSDFERLVKIKTIYQPRAELKPVYDACFSQFKNIFRRNQPVFRALARIPGKDSPI